VSGRIMRMGWGRLNVSKYFDSECTIRRNDQDLVGPLAGGFFACSVQNLFQGARIEGDFSNVNGWQVRLPVGTDVQVDDYIIERGRTLQVIEVASPLSYELYMIVVTQRV
jgi:hypothetical protein